MNDSPGALNLLSERLNELEKRVRALEHPMETRTTERSDGHMAAPTMGPVAVLETGRLLPIIGRALLGIAGAYVLRAIAEAGMLPKLPVSLFAAAYAFGWLVWSARVSSIAGRAVYAATASLILAPMLWENTLAFHVFTPMATAGVLAAFLTLAAVLELRGGVMRGMWIAPSITLLVTAALGFTTLDSLPFTAALLVAVFISEFARTRELQQPIWPLAVLVADVAVGMTIFIYSGAQDTRGAYPALSAAALIAPAWTLFAINGAAVGIRVVKRKCRIMIFEAIQIHIAFALAVAALLIFAPARGALALGLFCLALSAGSYICAFRYLREREERRSFRVFGAWSAALLLAGSLWSLQLHSAAILLAVAAVVATYLAGHSELRMLGLHGTIFLAGAAAIVRLPRFVYDCFAGRPPHSQSAGILIVSICAAAALVMARPRASGRVLNLVVAFVALCALTALALQGILAATGTLAELDAHHIAFLRTFTICVVTLAIAFAGSRWGRPALTYLAYAALALLGVKLLFEDLRLGHLAFVAASIALFAVTLIGVPRLVRLGVQMHSDKEIKSGSARTREISV